MKTEQPPGDDDEDEFIPCEQCIKDKELGKQWRTVGAGCLKNMDKGEFEAWWDDTAPEMNSEGEEIVLTITPDICNASTQSI